MTHTSSAGTTDAERGGLRGFVRDNGLGLFFTVTFLLALVGQAIAGHADFNNQLVADQLQPIGLAEYVTTSDFAVDVSENWQSEYLQFFLYVGVTVWLLQRGSPESKEMHKAGTESDRDQLVGEHARESSPKWAAAGGWRRRVYSHSLLLVMGTIFVLSWLVQSVTGVAAYNEQLLRQLQAPMSWARYLGAADFWSRTLQNWQSELLAVASMAVLSIYLRQRGSPESKPVGAPHGATGVEG
jgi:ABC-type long-subunit fatty acid transport system fused permease/ATPase subunit